MSRLRGFGWIGVVALVATACSSSDGASPSKLPPQDFVAPPEDELPFDRNTVVDADAFKDATGIDATAVATFFRRSPYDRSSFLETYQSNGVSAADAIVRSARNHGINPLVFLVFAEIAEGLVGAKEYPFPPERVEYVFGCGCLRSGACEPALAGFDRQVDCLGAAVRASLDAIAANGTTLSGWGPDKTSTTLDELKVTPANDATAVVYDRLPRVNVGGGDGAWLFWNLWNIYSAKIEYAGPAGAGGGNVGDACRNAMQCGFPNAICSTTSKNGLCTAACTDACPTPSDPELGEAFCADFGKDGGFCLPVCNLGAPNCRDGYTCKSVKRFGASAEQSPVCLPNTL